MARLQRPWRQSPQLRRPSEPLLPADWVHQQVGQVVAAVVVVVLLPILLIFLALMHGIPSAALMLVPGLLLALGDVLRTRMLPGLAYNHAQVLCCTISGLGLYCCAAFSS